MTSAISGSSQVPVTASAHTSTPSITDSTASSLPGAVSAQPPAKSYATATKTATPSLPAGATAPAHNAKIADSHMNGAMAQAGSQPANNTVNGNAAHDHSRKTSVVITQSGASGSYPNGGPVAQNGARPPINFGSMGSHGADPPGASFQSQNSLQRPQQDPRATTPTHSPSPIPQPAASGGRPPSNLPNQNNGGLAFGSLPADTEMVSLKSPSFPVLEIFPVT
jgi:translation initiation factor 4G